MRKKLFSIMKNKVVVLGFLSLILLGCTAVFPALILVGTIAVAAR